MRVALALTAMLFPGAALGGNPYMPGGGMGAQSCLVLLDQMEQARRHGGITSSSGLLEIVGFAQYTAGFITAVNMARSFYIDDPDGLFDGRGPVSVLLAAEPWCRDNPEATFDNALLAAIRDLAISEPAAQ